MRILYVLPYVPSPIRVRPYQIIRALAKAGHRVTVAALADEFTTDAALAELRSICESVTIVPHNKYRGALQALASLPTPTPLWAAFCHSSAMENHLKTLVATGQFDVAHIEHLRAAHFADALRGVPTAFDAVDCITALRRQMLDAGGSLPSRLMSWEEWTKLKTYEPQICHQFPEIAVTSAYDKNALNELDHTLPPISVIPNGVDCDYFHPDQSIAPEDDTIVFSGKMSYHANEDAARFLLTEVLVRLRELRPGVKVLIVGSKPSNSLRSLAEQVGGVTVTGYVEDIRPYLQRGVIAICPMRIGVGIQNKVLEAMAVGRPVVCSPLAARALTDAVTSDAGVYVAESAIEIARLCGELLGNQTVTVSELGKRARDYVAERHQWSVVAKNFVRIYEKIIVK